MNNSWANRVGGEWGGGGGFSRRGSRKRKSWGEEGETRPEAVIDFERDDGGFPLEVARGLGRGAWLCMANGSVFSPFLFSGEKWVGWDRRVYLFFFCFPFLFLFFSFLSFFLDSRLEILRVSSRWIFLKFEEFRERREEIFRYRS